jgi:glycosyltransferase involved in cell wall biosynthesis
MKRWGNPGLNFFEQLQFNRAAASIVSGLAPTHIHCHDLNSLLAGVWAKRRTGAKLVFDAHELMPESMGGLRQEVWGRIEMRCIDRCDRIIMPEINRIAYFKSKYPSVSEVVLLENFPRQADIPRQRYDLFRATYPIRSDQRIVLHTGLIAGKRHVEELIDSMSLCDERFVLVLLGMTFKGYSEIVKSKIKKLGLDKTVFLHDPVPQTQILRYMASCDIGTAFYRNTNINNVYCASNKLYEYIALNKAVLTNDYPGLLEAVQKWRQGICLDEVTPQSLTDAYLRAADPATVMPGKKKSFWEDQEERLVDVYREYAGRSLPKRSISVS